MSEYAFYDGKNPPKRVPVLPGAARDLETGDWIMGLDQERRGIKKARARAGYYEVRNTRKPRVEKGKEKLVRKLEALGDEVVHTWTVERIPTDELIDGLADTDRQFARQAVKQLRTYRKQENQSLTELRQNIDTINRILIRLVQDRYGED